MAMRWYRDRMWEIVRESIGKPKIAVEIGTQRAHWAWQLADKVGVGRLYCVDPWEVKPRFIKSAKAWIMNLKEYALRNVMPLRGKSTEWGRVFPFPIDLLFIDGSHVYKDVMDDLQLWYPKLRKKGLCFMHDVNEPDVEKAVLEYFAGHTEHPKKECLGPRHNILTRWVIKHE